MKHIYSTLIFFLDNTAENEHNNISYFTLSDTKKRYDCRKCTQDTQIQEVILLSINIGYRSTLH